MWNSAQMGNVFVAGINNVSTCLCAPCDITPEKNGYILEPTTEKQVSFKVFMSKLNKKMDFSDAGEDTNRAFYKNHFEQIIG